MFHNLTSSFFSSLNSTLLLRECHIDVIRAKYFHSQERGGRNRIEHRFTELNCQLSELASLVRILADRVTSNNIVNEKTSYQ